MGDEWIDCKLGELGEFRNGVNFNSTQEGVGLPVIKVKDFGDLTIAPDSGFDELNPQAIRIPADQLVEVGDTLIIRSNGNPALVGRSMLYRGGTKPTTFSGFCIRFRPDRSKIVPAFAAYFIRSPLCRQHFTAYGSGTGIQNLSQGVLTNLDISLPPLPEQRAIARVLGGLDDKIELNRRMNRTLEDLARGLFRSWFVDFDPVTKSPKGLAGHASGPPTVAPAGAAAAGSIGSAAGVTGSAAGMIRSAAGVIGSAAGVIASASPGGGAPLAPTPPPPARTPPPQVQTPWPTRLVDSPLGPIPEGWRVGTVGEIGTNPRRGVLPSEVDATTPYVGLEHMPRRCIALDDWGTAADVSSGKSRFSRGEILFGKLRPYFHKVGVALIDGVCSTDVIVAAPKKECWFGVLLGHLSSDDFIDYVDGASGGTRMPRTSWGDMARYQIVIPPEPIAASYSAWMRQVADMLRIHAHETRALASLRDALLPQLLSGEIRLREAERAVDDALQSTSPPPRASGNTSPRGGKAAGTMKGRA